MSVLLNDKLISESVSFEFISLSSGRAGGGHSTAVAAISETPVAAAAADNGNFNLCHQLAPQPPQPQHDAQVLLPHCASPPSVEMAPRNVSFVEQISDLIDQQEEEEEEDEMENENFPPASTTTTNDNNNSGHNQGEEEKQEDSRQQYMSDDMSKSWDKNHFSGWIFLDG